MSTTADAAALSEAASAAEVLALSDAERGDAAGVLSVLRALCARADDSRPGIRQPVRDVLRRVATQPKPASLLASAWRDAAEPSQAAIETVLAVLVSTAPAAGDAIVRDARREKAAELFLLADRVGALDDTRADELARDPSIGVVKAYVTALLESGRPAQTVERRLAAALHHANAKVRMTVLEAVAERGGAVAERIGRMGIGDADAAVRAVAIQALGVSRRREALPDLVRMLERGTRDDQVAAATALGHLGIPAVVAPLAAVFERKAMFRKERGEVQLAAVRALAGLPREMSRTVLDALAGDRDPEVARIAGKP